MKEMSDADGTPEERIIDQRRGTRTTSVDRAYAKPAGGADRAGLAPGIVEVSEPRIGVGLEDAHISREVPARVLAASVSRVEEGRRRWVAASGNRRLRSAFSLEVPDPESPCRYRKSYPGSFRQCGQVSFWLDGSAWLRGSLAQREAKILYGSVQNLSHFWSVACSG